MQVKIKYLDGQRFIVEARNHRMIIDQPTDKGGTDEGMNPLEIFLSALGSCVGMYTKLYCQNAGIEIKDLELSISSNLTTEKPLRFQEIDVKISLEEDIEERKQALLNFVNNCPVHNTIKSNPQVKITI